MYFSADISERDLATLDSLIAAARPESASVLLSHILDLAKWVIKEQESGRRIVSLGPSGEVIGELPPLCGFLRQIGLPYVQLSWTEAEIESLKNDLAKAPTEANERLRKLMKSDRNCD